MRPDIAKWKIKTKIQPFGGISISPDQVLFQKILKQYDQ